MVKKVTIEGKRPASATHYRLLELRNTINPATRKLYTLEEIGNLWGITKERVRQLEKRAIQLRTEGKLIVEAGG